MERAQCIILRGNRLLMVKLKLREDGHPFWCIPGGRIEEGETPAEAAIRELKEECGVTGKIVREISVVEYLSEESVHIYDRIYSFLIDVGAQEPIKGTDPDHEEEGLLDVKWLTLAEIPERDRAFLWAAGLLGIEEFLVEVSEWGDKISYPQQEES
jgi:8-oxo-dGTP diphosphatase